MRQILNLGARLVLALFMLGAAMGFMAVGWRDSRPQPARAAPFLQGADTPVPPYYPVISEFRSRGPAGESDDFVEIYNPTGEAIDIGGWRIKISDNAGGMTTLAIVNAGTVLSPGKHYLIANGVGFSGGLVADQVYIGDILDHGGVAIVEADGYSVVDQVGTHLNSAYLEGAPLSPLLLDSNQSYERMLGGSSGSCYDTNDNQVDFTVISPSGPQNFYSPSVVCTGAATATATQTSTNTATSTSTGTATPTLMPPAHLVISEFRTRGPGGTTDEFVEIFNPTGAAVSIGGWTIKKSGGCSTSTSTLLTITSGTILQPGQHYLMAYSSSSLNNADQKFTSSISDNGGIALTTGRGDIVDQVGMCDSTTYIEGDPLDPLTGSADQGYERVLGGCVDRDNNVDDFTLLSPSAPQSLSDPASPCPGAVTPTVTMTPTPTKTRTPTPTRSPTRAPTLEPGYVVINEFLPHPRSDWNGDGETNIGDEYIEIMNLGDEAINLRNWSLDDGDGGSSAYKIPELVLQPLQIVRLFGSQTGILLSDGGDSVRLFKAGGQAADVFTYAVVERADTTWCRLPDGKGVWRFVCHPTPGRPNIRSGSQLLPAQDTGARTAASTCSLADTVPQAVVQAECESSGGDIWNGSIWTIGRQIWLLEMFKWKVLVE